MQRATELFLEQQKSVTQFAYFQLGVAASAIAFAVHQTNGRALADTPWPIGLAVLLWALSFLAGSMGVEARIGVLTMNTKYLFAKEGLRPHEKAMLEGLPEYQLSKGEMEAEAQKPGRWFNWQRRFLFLGAVAYVGGHVMGMAAA